MSKFARRNALNPGGGPKLIARIPRIAALAGGVTVSNFTAPAETQAVSTNLAGGRSYKMTNELELATTALASMLNSGKVGRNVQTRTYESEDARIARIKKLVDTVDPEFTAKLALVVRHQHGLRSISHLLAALVAPRLARVDWAAAFFNLMIYRLDDIAEIIGAYNTHVSKPKKKIKNIGHGQNMTVVKWQFTNNMRKGFGQAMGRFNEYHFAKYQGKTEPSLAQLVKVLHPVPTVQSNTAIRKLFNNTLKQQDTWENELSLGVAKGLSRDLIWSSLIREEKLGIFALLRNLRNILENVKSKALIVAACAPLRSRDAVLKSKILPLQWLTAYEEISALDSGVSHEMRNYILESIQMAMAFGCENLPFIGERVLLAIDESSSMQVFERRLASLFAAMILKANPHAEVMQFANDARYVSLDKTQPLLTLATTIQNQLDTGGTNFHSIFQKANKGYDTIVILSDGEGWMAPNPAGHRQSQQGWPAAGGTPAATLRAYCQKYQKDPLIVSFDLSGDGSLMFREDGIITLAGFSFKTLDLLAILYNNPQSLVDEVYNTDLSDMMARFKKQTNPSEDL